MSETLFKPVQNPKPNYQSSRYKPEDIRTSNLASYRGSDLFFDPNVLPSLTQQSFKAECDINTIIAQYEATGFIHHSNPNKPLQGDFSEFGPGTDFLSAQKYLVEAQASFDSLPAKVRARFHNNPAELLEFLEDSQNESEARRLGLLNPLPEKQPEALPEASQGKKTAPAPESETDA